MQHEKSTEFPRFMIAAPGSGQGKTMITCAVLSLLSACGKEPCAFKCGPDYIDPMFHKKVLGIPSYNLDRFLMDENTLKYLLGRHGDGGKRIGVLEGVMGFYDGLGGLSDFASSWHVSQITGTPVILVMDASGRGLSVLASLKGFLEFRKENRIRGVIFNRLSPSLYPELKKKTEEELGVRVLGYLPSFRDFSWESRHLGLIRPEEVDGFRQQTELLAERAGKTLDLEGIAKLAASAEPIQFRPAETERLPACKEEEKPLIAVAMDEAFCFYYQDNLELLEAMGAELCFFSPIRDSRIPAGADGLYLGGGYPELYAEQLSGNISMRTDIREQLEDGLPCIAECGGFLYLQKELEDAGGRVFPMAGFLPGRGSNSGKLRRFGYVTMTGKREDMLFSGTVPAHEFHYWDTTENGNEYVACKKSSGKKWECAFGKPYFYAGFPHFHFYSCPPRGFVEGAFLRRRKKKEEAHRKQEGNRI